MGNPNVGKSTLMNQLVGVRISIAPFKAQTTRHRIMGIVNTPEMQIVFSDTPGVLKPNYKLQESMLAFSESALQDADVLLYVTDVVEDPTKNKDFLDKVAKMKVPVLREAMERLKGRDSEMMSEYDRMMNSIKKDIREEGKAAGLKEGLAEGRADIARNMIRESFPPERIAQLTGLSQDDVRRIAAEMTTG